MLCSKVDMRADSTAGAWIDDCYLICSRHRCGSGFGFGFGSGSGSGFGSGFGYGFGSGKGRGLPDSFGNLLTKCVCGWLTGNAKVLRYRGKMERCKCRRCLLRR